MKDKSKEKEKWPLHTLSGDGATEVRPWIRIRRTSRQTPRVARTMNTLFYFDSEIPKEIFRKTAVMRCEEITTEIRASLAECLKVLKIVLSFAFACCRWLGKRTITGTRSVKAACWNVRAASCWVALREKGINDVCACECVRACAYCCCVYVSVNLGLAARVKYRTNRVLRQGHGFRLRL